MSAIPAWFHPAVTLAVLVVALYSFVREKLAPDLTALLALLALLLAGVLTPQEAFAGFSHPATISVSAMLVLTAGLERTGAVTWVARHLVPLGRSEPVLALALMVVIGVLSGFINNTAAVAVFIPVVLDVCRRTGASPGRLLMPMSHAATLGGMCTLIGTSTNLATHEYARTHGLPGFGRFELAQVGLPTLVAGFAYILLVGRRLLPRSGIELRPDPAARGEYRAELVVEPGSAWIGREVRPDRLQREFELELLDLARGGAPVALEPPERYAEGDRLHVRGALDRVLALALREGLGVPRPRHRFADLPGPAPEAAPAVAAAAAAPAPAKVDDEPLPLAELVILPSSPLIGRTLGAARFQERYNVTVLAVHRPGAAVDAAPLQAALHGGDVVVAQGDAAALRELGEVRGFLLAGSPSHPVERPGKLGIALVTLVGVVTVAALGWLPIVTAATAGCAMLMLTGCLKPREAYQAINWNVVFVLAGALALGTALQKTGLTDQLASAVAATRGLSSPLAVLAIFYAAAVLVSEFMSNAATALLLAPLALSSAQHLGLNPMALMAAIMFGASAAFAVPIGYQTSLMIYGPGGYRFRDFLRMGLPLDLLVGAIALFLIPRFWPLVVR